MNIKEIEEFSQVRTKARAYFCYILSRSLPNNVPKVTLSEIKVALKGISKTLKKVDAMYILDPEGKQLINTISLNPKYARKGIGAMRTNRAYFYKVIKEKRCVLTDPYPSIKSNNLVVTAAHPIYDDNGKLLYIVCIDIALNNLLSMVYSSSIDSISGKIVRYSYAAFTIALALVALLLFTKGVYSFMKFGFDFREIDLKYVFESTILLTLSLAIFDLVKALFEEEVLGDKHKNGGDEIHKTMVRFIGSIIIALSIESLMLVFKFALTDSSKLQYAVLLIAGISILLASLAYYIKSLDKRNR